MAEELNNPLFDNEREFLERKKEEYERALRGDVDHIKEQSVQVGKVAAIGAGLAGIIWLIGKAFGGKKRKAKKQHDRLRAAQAGSRGRDAYYDEADEEFELNDEAFAPDRSAKFRDEDEHGHEADYHDADRYSGHSAHESAQAFMAQGTGNRRQAFGDENQDIFFGETAEYDYDTARDQTFENGFDSRAGRQHNEQADALPAGRLDFGPVVHLHRQSQQPAAEATRAYDDSRRLPAATDFSAGSGSRHKEQPAANSSRGQKSFGRQASGMLMSFLETDTGKAVTAQVSALALAYVAKLVNDKLPAGTLGKNADLADAPATTSFYPSAAPASSASTPAVSLTFTDAPTEHPTSK